MGEDGYPLKKKEKTEKKERKRMVVMEEEKWGVGEVGGCGCGLVVWRCRVVYEDRNGFWIWEWIQAIQ